MKNLSLLFFAASFTILATSCQKGNDCKPHDQTETQTVNAVLDKNTTYTFTLPAKGTFEITTQEQHAAASKLTSDVANTVYTFTPAADYVGLDKVIISASEQNGACNKGGASHQQQHGNGSCGQHHSNGTDFVINLTVKDVVTVN